MKRILLLAISTLFISQSKAQWSAMGTGFSSGAVNALCIHNGELYAGGSFTGMVAKWNSASQLWTQVGTLAGTQVKALISFNGSLYAGGALTTPGPNVVRYDAGSSAWVTSGGGLIGLSVNCFIVFHDSLFAGGSFTQSGTQSVKNCGKLDLASNSWKQVGGGTPPNTSSVINALAVYQNNLYTGGMGTSPHMDRVINYAWDQNFAGTFTGGPDNEVKTLTVFPYQTVSNLVLWIGGSFSQPSPRVGTFSSSGGFGTSFNNFSGTTVNTLMSNSPTGTLLAGGAFSVTGSHTAVNLARKAVNLPWDSLASTTLSAGGTINAISFYNGKTVIGGSFTSVGGQPRNRVAISTYLVEVDEVSDNVIANTVYPNPMIEQALVNIQTRTAMVQPELRMLDQTGKSVDANAQLVRFNHGNNEIEFRIERNGLAAGIYYYFLQDQGSVIATGKMIVE